MKLPKEFTIANNKYTIDFTDTVKDVTGNDLFGDHSAVTNKIRIAKTVDKVELNEEQIKNTFWHELFHAFQYFFCNRCDEAEAQCFANFMREYESSVKYD